MQFKNERLTVIHMPDATLIGAGDTFNLSAKDGTNPAIRDFIRARWLTPQDVDAMKFVTSMDTLEASKTAQRLAAIEKKHGKTAPDLVAAAKANQAKLDAAQSVVRGHKTPQELQAEENANLAAALTAEEAAAAKIEIVKSASEEQLLELMSGETREDVRDAILARGKALMEAHPALSASDHAAAQAQTSAAQTFVPAAEPAAVTAGATH